MKILVVGSGAREHALAWKISKSELTEKIFVFPGNAGMEDIATTPDLSDDSVDTLVKFALDEKIDLTVIGPEKYLAEGLVDVFEKNGLKVFGVNQKAAQLESSKAFAKDMMKKYNVATAKYFVVSNKQEGHKILKSMPYPVVIKADGLAAGKGVSIVSNPTEAEQELADMLDGKFSDAGKKVVIEEFLDGEELSLILFVDGEEIRPMQFSQDHKAAYDGDKGPNTGGMGAYTPVAFGDDKLYSKVKKEVILPLLKGFKKEGIDFRGVLYIGLMIVKNNPYVLEFNVRFGDPETEPLMLSIKSDIVPYMLAVSESKLSKTTEIESNPGYFATVVMASGGYPGNYKKGHVITGLNDISDEVSVFHAGTAKNENGDFINVGGRVLMLSSGAETINGALDKVYEAANKINFEGSFYRKDIGYREIKRK